MINPNVKYRVTGRYMDGQKLIGYHLVGEDGSQSREGKDRVIWLIAKGVITNLRMQTGADNEVIIRGKGVNLNNLPVYDPNKDKYRNNAISQEAAHSNVQVRSNTVDNASPMGQYKILKRIMYKNKCLGYEVQDYSGTKTRKKREDVMKLANERLISNAIVQKYTRPETNRPELVLRGVGCDLGKLPILLVNEQGKIIDPTVDRNSFTVRSAYMKHSGIVHDSIHNVKIPFKAGDFILCGADGKIDIKSKIEVESGYTKDNESNSAVCDDYLKTSQCYYIEIFGSKPIQITESIVKNWVILKPRNIA